MPVNQKCKIQEGWFSDERFKCWLQKLDSDLHDVFYKFWQKRFSIAGEDVKQIEHV